MGFLRRMFGQEIPKGNARALIRIAKSDNYPRAEQAILALTELPLSEKVLDCLMGLSDSGSHSGTVVTALGLLGHPRAAQRLVDFVASESLISEAAGSAVGQPRNNHAVPGLLNIAVTSQSYTCVKVAVEALAAVGTGEAKAAMKQFCSHPSRKLSSGSQTILSSALGQVPSEGEVAVARREFADIKPFTFLPRTEALEKVRSVLAQPDELEKVRSLLVQPHESVLLPENLLSYLSTPDAKHEFYIPREVIREMLSPPLTITKGAMDACIEAAREDAPGRRQEIRTLVSSGRNHWQT